MDGTTRSAGAVAALQGYRAAVSVARKVMEELPHSVLVGAGAARFAAEMGFRTEKLLTEAAEEAYLAGLDGRLPVAYAPGGAVVPILTALIARHRGEGRPVHSAGTVNFIAQDAGGTIASVSSSSGWPWKYPGRVGDAAVIGAGNYADSRFGAATCVGWGELAIRAGVARGMIARLEAGHGLGEACRRAFADAICLDPALAGMPLRMLAMDSAGNHTCHATSPNGKYLAWTDTMSAYATLDCTLVDAAGA
jgi:beta-aspartyl-peptidase (threonine type)